MVPSPSQPQPADNAFWKKFGPDVLAETRERAGGGTCIFGAGITATRWPRPPETDETAYSRAINQARRNPAAPIVMCADDGPEGYRKVADWLARIELLRDHGHSDELGNHGPADLDYMLRNGTFAITAYDAGGETFGGRHIRGEFVPRLWKPAMDELSRKNGGGNWSRVASFVANIDSEGTASYYAGAPVLNSGVLEGRGQVMPGKSISLNLMVKAMCAGAAAELGLPVVGKMSGDEARAKLARNRTVLIPIRNALAMSSVERVFECARAGFGTA